MLYYARQQATVDTAGRTVISAVQPVWDLILNKDVLIKLQTRVVSCYCKVISAFRAKVVFTVANLVVCRVGQ